MSKYGPIPGLLFDYFLPPDKCIADDVEGGKGEVEESLHVRISEYDLVLDRKIQDLLSRQPSIALWTEQYGADSNPTIFAMHPCKVEGLQYLSLFSVFGLATQYIGYRVGAATVNATLEGARMMYEFLQLRAETKRSAGWIFEARTHVIFQRGGRFEVTKLGGSTTITIEISNKPCRTFSQASELGSLLRRGPQSRNIDPDMIGAYFKSQGCSLGSLDSFAVTTFAASREPVLVIFHMTVSTSHPVKADGLASVWAGIPADLKKTPPLLVFVVPVDIAKTFPRQTIVPAAGNTSPFDKWDQYVLAVSDESLWNNNPPDFEESRISDLTSS